jgi:hypothetical protein
MRLAAVELRGSAITTRPPVTQPHRVRCEALILARIHRDTSISAPTFRSAKGGALATTSP